MRVERICNRLLKTRYFYYCPLVLNLRASHSCRYSLTTRKRGTSYNTHFTTNIGKLLDALLLVCEVLLQSTFTLRNELIIFQESSSQSSAGELSSSQVEVNHTSKPPSRQSSCLSLNSTKVHPEVTPEIKSPGTLTESATTADIAGSDSADERRSHGSHGSHGGALAAARSEGSQTETPTYRIYAISVRCTASAICYA